MRRCADVGRCVFYMDPDEISVSLQFQEETGPLLETTGDWFVFIRHSPMHGSIIFFFISLSDFILASQVQVHIVSYRRITRILSLGNRNIHLHTQSGIPIEQYTLKRRPRQIHSKFLHRNNLSLLINQIKGSATSLPVDCHIESLNNNIFYIL